MEMSIISGEMNFVPKGTQKIKRVVAYEKERRSWLKIYVF